MSAFGNASDGRAQRDPARVSQNEPAPAGSAPPFPGEAAGPAAPAGPRATPMPPAGVASAQPGEGRSELRRRRDLLAEQVTELHWDLGGLAYEMAIRDHFRLDVLVLRAALLQERDAELAEVERLLRMEDSASIGNCPRCGAPHSRGAVFCWQCGIALMERSSAGTFGDNDATAVMDAVRAENDASAPGPATPPHVSRPQAPPTPER